MVSLLPSPTRSRSRDPDGEPGPRPPRRPARRPVVLVATLGGLAAATVPLAVCLLLGLLGWYLADGGGHGAPRDGLRAGATAWLMGHGSGVHVQGVAVTAVPLGLTVLAAAALWRAGSRVGVSLAAYGPDADGLSDGQRDVVVPLAGAALTAGYVAVAALTAALVTTPATALDARAVLLWSVALCLVVGVPAVAAGSGRAAVLAARLPATLRAIALVARRVVVLWSAVAAVALLASLVADLSTAANIMTALGGGSGALLLVVVASLAILPNATAFSSSFLLGPGFVVGTGALVTPTAVLLGPLPALPLLAALPDDGTPPGWVPWLQVLPVLVALVAAMRCQRAWPTPYYVEGAVRGVAGGVVAGVAVGALTALAGGAVGPGRMADVAPFAFEALLHAVTSFGLGGLVGGLVVTWWQRRAMPVEVTLQD